MARGNLSNNPGIPIVGESLAKPAVERCEYRRRDGVIRGRRMWDGSRELLRWGGAGVRGALLKRILQETRQRDDLVRLPQPRDRVKEMLLAHAGAL